ncbi:hypothetical protein [Pleomorphovibrio marinus]|uniref:hypothetical protein n=1 Tax=Pleomorphovibrio marinus TaxID=2164132 RepID=UPI000E0B8C99|nr:hypothetical protein [Pleomorphovibrio marinus]
MKFPSIFRVNRPAKFNITPRHYDPVKEEIQERTSRIKRELEEQGIINPEGNGREGNLPSYGSSIRGAFTKGSPIKRKPSNIFESAGLMRLLILLILIGGFGGYIYIGPDILYYFLYLGGGIALLVGLFRLKSIGK